MHELSAKCKHTNKLVYYDFLMHINVHENIPSLIQSVSALRLQSFREMAYTQKIGNHIVMRDWKRFPGAEVMTQNTTEETTKRVIKHVYYF